MRTLRVAQTRRYNGRANGFASPRGGSGITPSSIIIAGAGSVGCYVGGCLALAGRDVTLLGRSDLVHAIAVNGLRITDHEGRDQTVNPDRILATTDPASAFAKPGVILVTVKSATTRQMADLISTHAQHGATVVTLQNGAENLGILERVLGTSFAVVPGMVPFNIVQTRDAGDVPHMHRGTSGRIHVAAGTPHLRDWLNVRGAPVVTHRDMTAIAWGKLVLNLNNALNALSGLPLRKELADRRWRLILAAQADEALSAIKASGRKVARVDGLNPKLMPYGLRLPDMLFRAVAGSMLSVDPQARSSMWDDLQRRRPTEIDVLQGAVIDLARRAGTEAPMTSRVRDLIRAAETAAKGAPGLSPDEVALGVIKLT